jgi:prevent-host-death family protein
MKTIAAGAFKARCLRIMEVVRTKRTPVLITKRGKPLAKLAPPDDKPPDILGRLAGKIEILGDMVSPITSLEDWEGLK